MMRKSGSYRVRAKAVEQRLWSTSTTAWCFSLHARSADPAPAQRLVELDDGHQVEPAGGRERRSEEHTSELQSLRQLVCRLLLEKKKLKRVRSQLNQTRGSCGPLSRRYSDV